MTKMPLEVVEEGNNATPEDAPPSLIGKIQSWAAGQGVCVCVSEEGLDDDGLVRTAPPHGKGKGRYSDSVKGTSLAYLSTTDPTLHQIIQPHMPWKDANIFLFEKVWTYITGDELSPFFYVSPDLSRLKKR